MNCVFADAGHPWNHTANRRNAALRRAGCSGPRFWGISGDGKGRESCHVGMKMSGEVERESAADKYRGERGMGGAAARGGWRRGCGAGLGCDGSGACGRWIGRLCAFDRGGRPRKSPLPPRHSYVLPLLTRQLLKRAHFLLRCPRPAQWQQRERARRWGGGGGVEQIDRRTEKQFKMKESFMSEGFFQLKPLSCTLYRTMQQPLPLTP
jgi:hypothetical protein